MTYSITELLNVADALIAPVRIGVAKQTVAVHKSIGSSDVLDMMERYLNSESDLTTILTGFDSKRKVCGSLCLRHEPSLELAQPPRPERRPTRRRL